MPLTDQERAILADLTKHPEGRCLKYPTHPIMKSLEERGYIHLQPALSGPLAIPTGEEWATLTPAGLAAVGGSESSKSNEEEVMRGDQRFNGIRTELLAEVSQGLPFVSVAESETLAPAEVQRLNDALQRMADARGTVLDILRQAQRMAGRFQP